MYTTKFGARSKVIKIISTISETSKKKIFTNSLFVDHLTSEYILVLGNTLLIGIVYFIFGSFSLLKSLFSG